MDLPIGTHAPASSSASLAKPAKKVPHAWQLEASDKVGHENIILNVAGTRKIYTTTGFGPRKTWEMAGVDHLVVYMQIAIKYCRTVVCRYTTKGSTPAIS